jgi:hypothetical protein
MTTKLFDLVGFAAELKAIEHDFEALGPKIIERACQIVQKKAKTAIGKEHELWAPLAESTIHDKQAHGYRTPAPLLRTGEMRDSIEYVVHGNEGCDEMLVALNRTRENLEAKLSEEIGAETAAAVAEAFIGAVAGHKRELETNGGGSA